MLDAEPLSLTDRLRLAAQIWADAHGGRLSRLGRLVLNDTSFFSRTPPPSPTTVTLERFARFLGDPASWPEGEVPGEVRTFVHVVGVSPDSAAASPDIAEAAIAPPPASAESTARYEAEPSGRPLPVTRCGAGGEQSAAGVCSPKPASAADTFLKGAAA